MTDKMRKDTVSNLIAISMPDTTIPHVVILNSSPAMQVKALAVQVLMAIGAAILSVAAFAAPTVDSKTVEAYRAEYKDAVVPVKYVFTHADGSACCSAGAKGGVRILNITAAVPVALAYSPEIEKLFQEHFDVEIDHESLIATPAADFVVLTLSRPAEYNSRYVRCAAGMGESRAYLVAIAGAKATVVNRKFGGCGITYQVIHDGGKAGYTVSNDELPNAGPTTYWVSGDSILRQRDARSPASR